MSSVVVDPEYGAVSGISNHEFPPSLLSCHWYSILSLVGTEAVILKLPVPDANIVSEELFRTAFNIFCPNCRKSICPFSSRSFGVVYPSFRSPEVILPNESTVYGWLSPSIPSSFSSNILSVNPASLTS